ncbi:hypothetical protein CR513_60079, partial [Mucuna pruriens]
MSFHNQTIIRRKWDKIYGDEIWYLVREDFASTLIPKVESLSDFKDFKPIRLYNIIYKLIRCDLLNNISVSLQITFLLGRSTFDNTIILQEIVYRMQKFKRKKGNLETPLGFWVSFCHSEIDYALSKIGNFNIHHPLIEANNFKLKPTFISMVQNLDQFKGLPTKEPLARLKKFLHFVNTIKINNPTNISQLLVDRTITHPLGIVEDILVKVKEFIFLTDLVILDMEGDDKSGSWLPNLKSSKGLDSLIQNIEAFIYLIHLVYCILGQISRLPYPPWSSKE